MINILQAIYEQIIYGYDVQILNKGFFFIPEESVYMKVKIDSTGKVKELKFKEKEKEKENEKCKRRIN